MKKQLILLATTLVAVNVYSQLQTSGSIAFPPYRFGETQIGGLLGSTDIRGIGIGNFSALGAGAIPQSRLHINNFFFPVANTNPTVIGLQSNLFRTDGNQSVINRWQLFTGATAAATTEKGMLFTDPLAPTQTGTYNPGVTNARVNQFGIQSTQGDIVFWAKGAANASPGAGENLPLSARMRISAADYIDPAMPFLGAYPTTRVGIFSGFRNATSGYDFLTDPLAMLHIGDAGSFGIRGHRTWMNYGTYVQRNSDNMYVGLKTNEFFPNLDRQDAVINWADNNSSTGAGPDVLRFIFTGPFLAGSDAGSPGSQNGLEVMRIVPTVNSDFDASVGIGDFSGNSLLYAVRTPRRKLEILSDKTTVAGTNNPQLRLTHTQERTFPIIEGIFTDLQTTNLGDFAVMNSNIALTNTVTTNIAEEQRFMGINTNTPGNTLEINSQYASSATPNGQPQDPTIGTPPTGWAGVRFSDLKSTSILQANPSFGVLSVNANGDIIFVRDQIGGGAGTFAGSQNGLNNTITPANPTGRVELGGILLHPTTITNNGNANILQYDFSSGGNIAIGQPTNTLNAGSVFVFGGGNTTQTTNGNFSGAFIAGNNNITDHFNIRVIGNSNTLKDNGDIVLGNNNLVGTITLGSGNYIVGTSNTVDGNGCQVSGLQNVIGTDPLFNAFPINSYAIGNRNVAYGGGGIAIGNKTVSAPSGDMVSIGQHTGNPALGLNNYFAANAGSGFVAVQNAHLNATVANGEFIPAINVSSNNRVGIKKYIATTALDVFGTVTCTGFNNTSDITMKTNVSSVTTSTAQKLQLLDPISFEWIIKTDTGMYGTQYGFSAQQVETVLPELVKMGKDGKKSLNEMAMVPLLVKSIQEQQNTIDSMRTMMNQLASLINSCCQNNVRTQSANVIDIQLSDKDVVVLNQNVPNPFAEQTTITYNIPEKSGFAQIIFNDMKGQIMKVVDIKTKGKGQLNVFANDLSSGMYSYTLYVDGKAIDTKKMVKTE